MSADRDELARDIVTSALSRSQATGRSLELHRELVEMTTPVLAGDMWAAGWRKVPSREALINALMYGATSGYWQKTGYRVTWEHLGPLSEAQADAILALFDGDYAESSPLGNGARKETGEK